MKNIDTSAMSARPRRSAWDLMNVMSGQPSPPLPAVTEPTQSEEAVTSTSTPASNAATTRAQAQKVPVPYTPLILLHTPGLTCAP